MKLVPNSSCIRQHYIKFKQPKRPIFHMYRPLWTTIKKAETFCAIELLKVIKYGNGNVYDKLRQKLHIFFFFFHSVRAHTNAFSQYSSTVARAHTVVGVFVCTAYLCTQKRIYINHIRWQGMKQKKKEIIFKKKQSHTKS